MSNIITLAEAVELKDKVQETIISNQAKIKNENCLPTSQKRNFNIPKLLKETDKLREAMIELKLEIQRANLKVIEGEKYCIQYYVFLLAEIKRKRDNLSALACHEGSVPKSLIHGKVSNDELIKVKSIISSDEREKMLGELTMEYYSVLKKLTELNNLVTITFESNII